MDNWDPSDVENESRRERLANEALTRTIIGAYFRVYNDLGYGHLESTYAEAMAIELAELRVVAEREAARTVWYRGHPVGEFRADMIVEGAVVVELKAAHGIDPAHEAQLLNYLRAAGLSVGLLLNFGPRPQFRRLAWRGGVAGSSRRGQDADY